MLSQRHRKRPADDDLLSKIREYEDLLRTNNVKFQPFDNSWIPSQLEKPVSRPGTQQPVEAQSSAEQESQIDLTAGRSGTACLWSGLPKEVCSLIQSCLFTPE